MKINPEQWITDREPSDEDFDIGILTLDRTGFIDIMWYDFLWHEAKDNLIAWQVLYTLAEEDMPKNEPVWWDNNKENKK